ncbi:MAG: hypothetical protein AMXMBFR53_41420 [Gemmatimonadota bacterium]
MDSVRYVFALIWLVAFPILLFWLALHPFVAFWRRMGVAATYATLVAGIVAGSALLYTLRGPLLSIEFGTGPVMWALTALAYAASIAVESQARKHLGIATLVGVPEVRGDARSETLLTQGIYARMRHPRYVGATLGYVASAFLANYLFLYAALPVFLFLVHTVVLLEERELLDRFGDDYRAYMDRVPRYLPRLSGPPARP